MHSRLLEHAGVPAPQTPAGGLRRGIAVGRERVGRDELSEPAHVGRGDPRSKVGERRLGSAHLTRPIGEHIIKVEADHRAFRVPKDDGPLIPIKRSQVTDA